MQPILAPDIEPSLLKEEMLKLHLSVEKIQGPINVLFLKIKNRNILIDTGSGNYFGSIAGKLIGNLKSIGIVPEDITDIIISHVHGDHVGGILDENKKLNFPNAKYHIAKKEYDFWFSEKPDFSKSKGDKVALKNIEFARSILGGISSRLNKFEYGEKLFDTIIPELAAGHTAGHTIFSIESNTKKLRLITDIFHSSILISKPEWGIAWDSNFDEAIFTRKRILKEVSERNEIVLGCHLPWPGIGFIDYIQESYRWEAYPIIDYTGIVL